MLIFSWKGGVKMNVKNAKVVSSNHITTKFGDGVIFEPQYSDVVRGYSCVPTKCGSSGCGSSNKIKVLQIKV